MRQKLGGWVIKPTQFIRYRVYLAFFYRWFCFALGLPLVTFSKEKIDAVDEAKKTVSYHVLEGDVLNYYKNFRATLVVTPKENGSLVQWICEFEKASDEIPDPNIIKDFAVKNIQEVDQLSN